MPPRTSSDRRSTTITTNNDIDMATITATATATATATRQQLRGDYSLREGGSGGGGGANSGSAAFPTSQLPQKSGNVKSGGSSASPWGGTATTTSSNTNTNEGDKSTWTGSWSKIQSIASTVLGSVGGLDEEEAEERNRRMRIAERRRRAGLDTFVHGGKSSGSNSSSASVSSSLRSRVGGGGSSIGDSEGDLRSRGRRKVESDEAKPRRPPNVSSATSTTLFASPLHKRPTSPEILPPQQNRASSSPPSTDRGEDTLAYVHKVRPTDTLEGVVIMYNIHPSALRRANRLWMGDSIQWRTELYLPVDECLVKGRPLTKEEGSGERNGKECTGLESSREPESTLLDLSETEVGGIPNGVQARQRHKNSSTGSVKGSIAETEDDTITHIPSISTNGILKGEGEESPYRHHSFVIISGIGKVEIGRLSRNKLSYFPSRKGNRGRGLSASSSTIPEDIGIHDNPPSVFKFGGRVSEAYTGMAGPQLGGAGTSEIPTFGQMFNQVARETRDGVENVGSLVEGFVRKMAVKVGEMARDGTDAAIELAEHVGNHAGDRSRIGGEERIHGYAYKRIGDGGVGGSTHGAGSSARDRPGGGSARGLRGRISNSNAGSSSSAEASRVGSRAGSLTRKEVGLGRIGDEQ